MRSRLLFLSQTLPIPEGGASIRSYNLLRVLARTYDVTVLSFYRRGSHPRIRSVARGLEAVREFAEVEVFPVPQEFNRLRFAADHVRSLVNSRAYTAYAYDSRAFGERVHTHISSGDHGLVHLDSLDLVSYLPMLAGVPVACTHQNVESRLLRRRAERASTPALRRYLSYQAGLVEAEERAWCGRVQTNLVVSQDDADELRRIAPGARIAVAPNGVDTTLFQPQDVEQNGLVFVGPGSWGPNAEAMHFLGREILPRLRALGSQVEATWVGRADDRMQREFRRQYGMHMTGFVDDVRPYVGSAECYVVPLRTGGGTRLKILEAWAMGKAVVSTSAGCEGLAAEDGVNILVRDSAESFAGAIRDVLEDSHLRTRLGAAARATAVKSYDWEVIGKAVLDEYASLGAGSTEVSLV